MGSIASQAVYVASVAAMNVLVVRYWGAAGRGDLAVFVVASTLCATIGGRGFGDVAIWAVGRDAGENLGRAFRASLQSSVFLGLVGAGVCAVILPWHLALLTVPGTVLLHVFRSATTMRLANGEVARFNVERTALPFATTAGIAISVVVGGDSPVYGYLVGQTLAAALAARILVAQRLLARTTGELPDAARTIGRQSVIGNTVGSSLSRIDVLAVGLLADARTTGIYSVALSVSEVSLTAAHALSFHALREGASGTGLRRRTIRRVLWTTATLSMLALVGLALFATPILGEQFDQISSTFALLIPGIVAIAAVRVIYSADLTSGQGASATRAMAVAVGVILALDVALVPWFDENGAAVASTVAYGVALTLIWLDRRSQRVTPTP